MFTKDNDKDELLRIRKIETAYRKYGKILVAEVQKHYFENQQIAEDIVQTTFERVIKYGHDFATYDDKVAFRFLYSIMKHEAYKLKKKEAKFSKIADVDQIMNDLSLSAIESSTSPEFLYLERTIVREAMKQLPDDYASILYLHYYHGYKFREIGDFLGISENTAIQKCYYIRKKLKQILIKEGFHDEADR